jgi:hypothetical protein
MKTKAIVIDTLAMYVELEKPDAVIVSTFSKKISIQYSNFSCRKVLFLASLTNSQN